MANIIMTVNASTIVADTTKGYRMNDTDMQILLDTIKMSYPTGRPGQQPPPSSPTNEQLILYWMQGWIDKTIRDVQSYNTVPPPPITIS